MPRLAPVTTAIFPSQVIHCAAIVLGCGANRRPSGAGNRGTAQVLELPGTTPAVTGADESPAVSGRRGQGPRGSRSAAAGRVGTGCGPFWYQNAVDE